MACTADGERHEYTPGASGLGRRAFVTGLVALTSALALWPTVLCAQQPALPVIGYVSPRSPETSAPFMAAFHKGLAETGYVEGRNVRIEYRWAHGRLDRMRELVADVISRPVAVIVAPVGIATALAAKSLGTTVPLVFNTSGDPVRAGVVASLNRPGDNITGVVDLRAELGAKQLGLLRELLPRARHVPVLVNPTSPLAEPTIKDVGSAAATVGWRMDVLNASTIGEIDAAFANVVQLRADAMLVSADASLIGRRDQLLALAASHAVPMMFGSRDDAQAGALISYGSSMAERERQTGIYAGRILKGEKPADLPVMLAARFELVINLKTARTLGLTIPNTLLVAADEVLE